MILLTELQCRVLRYLWDHRNDDRRPNFFRIGWRTQITYMPKLYAVLRSLRAAGYIEFEDGKSRTIQFCDGVFVDMYGRAMIEREGTD